MEKKREEDPEKRREEDPERRRGEGVAGRRVEDVGGRRVEDVGGRRGEGVGERRGEGVGEWREEVDVRRRGEEVDVRRRGENGVGERGEGDAEERQERDAVGKWKVDSEGMDQDQYLWQENIKTLTMLRRVSSEKVLRLGNKMQLRYPCTGFNCIHSGTSLIRTPLGPTWLVRCPYFRERIICIYIKLGLSQVS